MGTDETGLSEFLDGMALHVLMVEPGDLSQVGMLLELLERFLEGHELETMPVLKQMGGTFKTVVEKIIMGELSDTTESYERLGQSISCMQEVLRRNGEVDEALASQFRQNFVEMGFAIEQSAESLPQAAGKEAVLSAAETVVKEQPIEAPAAAASSGPVTPDFLQDKDLIAGFIAESFEHLESIEVNIIDLEQKPNDLEIINSIFRPFHTIKGVSGFLNLKNINKLAHTTENLLDDVRNGRFGMDSEIIDVVLSVGDFMRAMIQNLKDVLDHGMASYKTFDISPHVERVLNVQAIRSGGGGATPSVPAPQQTAVDRPVSGGAGPDLSQRGHEVGGRTEKVPATARSEEAPEKFQEAYEASASAMGRSAVQAGPVELRKKGIVDSIKVDVEKLDNLVNAVGELVIMQSQVRQNPLLSGMTDQKLTRDFAQLGRITSELQKTAMSMRMVPIRQTFQKMIRLVRDLSKKSGKKVDLVMSGEETEIDRNMVDSIYDPLVHMIRNSVDHGVQTPEERKRLGKPENGTVSLRAYQKGGNMVIEIEDDGQGLDTRRIRAKAIERGLIREDEALSNHEIANLIFVPGFSTAEKITDVSGRGVGMDVVKKAVERLRGKVEVTNNPGNGTLFTIRLPLTLAIIDGILVRVGKERFIIPTVSIQESIRPLPEMYQTVHDRGEALLIRQNLIAIVRLYEIFGVREPEATDIMQGIVVVVENEGQQRALLVDELLGKQEVVIKNLGGYMSDIKGVAGGTILGDGRVGLIVDLSGLFELSGGSNRASLGGSPML